MQERLWRPRNVLLIFGFILSLAGAALWAVPVDAQGAPPTPPIVYSGIVTVGGSPAQDGLLIVARIADHETEPVVTMGGRYAFLKVTAPEGYLFQPVTFHLKDYEVQAVETVQFRAGPAFVDNFTLSFPVLPTPTPTPTPTATPIPPTPTPTATPPPDIAATVTAQLAAIQATAQASVEATVAAMVPPTPTPTPTATPEPPTPTPAPTAEPEPTPDVRATVMAEVTATAFTEQTIAEAVSATATAVAGEPTSVCGRSPGGSDMGLLLGGSALLGLLAWRRLRP